MPQPAATPHSYAIAVQSIMGAQFTLHDSWATLKRYANLRAEDVPEK